MAKEVKQRSLDSFFQLKRSGDSNAIVLDDESDTTHSEDTVTKKKKRKFQPSWKTDYKWLENDQENSKMFCSVCREFPNRKNVNYSLRIGTVVDRRNYTRIFQFPLRINVKISEHAQNFNVFKPRLVCRRILILPSGSSGNSQKSKILKNLKFSKIRNSQKSEILKNQKFPKKIKNLKFSKI